MFWVSILIFIIIFFLLAPFINTTNHKSSEEDVLDDIMQDIDKEDIEVLEDIDEILEVYDDVDRIDDVDEDLDEYEKLGIQAGQDFFISRNRIEVASRDGYERYEIKGMRFCSLQIYDIGFFEGYAKAESDNKYDEYAISIYREDYKRIGYLPAANSILHQYIVENGGCVHCIGVVQARHNRGGFFGEVIVECDKTKVKERNKYTDVYKYYVYNENALKNLFNGA